MVIMFVDHDDVGPKEARILIENARLPNNIIPPKVMALEERDIGEWVDEHPLNNARTMKSAFEKLFQEEIP